MIKRILTEKQIPDVLKMDDGRICLNQPDWEKRRREILDFFRREVYGYMPLPPGQVLFETVNFREYLIGGKASYQRIRASFQTPRGPYAFEFDVYIPYSKEKVPAIVYIQFPEFPIHSTFPVEEIIGNGFAVAMMRNCNVMEDRDDFSQGLAGMYLKDQNERSNTEWGAIGAWAFAASRVMDYFYTLNSIDFNCTAVIGHSRLGKTALWCGANDERFKLAAINGSGSTGASLSKFKDKKAETIEQIVTAFPYWFCKNYYKYAGKEQEMPFDQHMLTASLAPRHFYVCSASEDAWAGPRSEFLCCAASDSPYKLLGMRGFVGSDHFPEGKCVYDQGDIGYSMQEGKHFMGMFEWNNVMNYMKKMSEGAR